MPEFGAVTPILRIFDEATARAFYLDFLGFSLGFEHRFGENFPVYIGVTSNDCAIHLSEHHGDACPGAHVRIKIKDIQAFARKLADSNYKYAKPQIPDEITAWGTREMTITDPFGNRLTFVENI